MRGRNWYVALLIGLMCLIRFSLGAVGYADPHWLMAQLGVPAASNIQMPYIIRVWAIRDMVLAILVVVTNQSMVKALLLACMAIDCTDILSAHLSGTAGLFNAAETWSLKLTAIAALVPEAIAFVLLTIGTKQEPISLEKHPVKNSEINP